MPSTGMDQSGEPALSAETVERGLLPVSWNPLFADIRAFLNLLKELKTHPPETADHQRIRTEMHQFFGKIVDASPKLFEPRHADARLDQSMRETMATSYAVAAYLKEAVAAEELVDMAGSKTLSSALPDFTETLAPVADVTIDDIKTLLGHVSEELQLSGADVDRLAGDIKIRLTHAAERQAFVDSIQDEFNLHPDSPTLETGALEFFKMLYPDPDLAPGEVQVIISSTMIFLVLPFREGGETLITDRFTNLPEVEQAGIREFLKSLAKFPQKRYACFPAFGFIDDLQVDKAKLKVIADRCGFTVDEAISELGKVVVTALSIDAIDKWVVHDVWAHAWQGLLLDFDLTCEKLAQYADPLQLTESALNTDGSSISFRECFVGTGDALTLDEDKLRQFYRAEVLERLPIALAPAVAEMMADVIEFEYLEAHPQDRNVMTSSSEFKYWPSKLDLTLNELSIFFAQATKVFRLWANSDKRSQHTVQDLIAQGASDETASRAVDRAREIWKSLEQEEFSAEPVCHIDEGANSMQVNLIGKIYLNFVSLNAAVLRTYNRIERLGTGDLPLTSFKKLLVVAACLWYEQDRAENLWRLDEFVESDFVPLCQRLSGDTALSASDIDQGLDRLAPPTL